MKHIFLDTNFVIDYFVREDFQGNAEKLMTIEKKAQSQFFISYLTVANFAYIMRKMPVNDLRSLIRQICRNFIVISNTETQIRRALDLNSSDFEDMLQYQAALDAHCDCIITRNENDFAFSAIPVMSPSSYLKTLINDQSM